MSSIGSTVDLIRFHTTERHLFNRLVQDMGKDPIMAKVVIALWLWLEEIGNYDLNRTIFAHEDPVVDAVFNEAIMCLDFIGPDAVPPMDRDDMPILSELINEPINSRFFYCQRILASQGIARVMETICSVIFGANAAHEVNDPAIQPILHPYGEGSSAQGASTRPSTQSTLNPAAMPFFPSQQPSQQQTQQDQRTLFMTLSRGYPLTREEIIDFFTSRWGQVVESLTMEVTPEGVDPLYGRMVLNNASVIPSILNGQVKAKFNVRRRNLWVRRYVRNN